MQVEIELETLQECFADLPDPRVVGRTAHRLQDILFMTLCGVLCGMDDEEEIERLYQRLKTVGHLDSRSDSKK